jgi:hypothetical protein
MKPYAIALSCAIAGATALACGGNDPNTLGQNEPGAGGGSSGNGNTSSSSGGTTSGGTTSGGVTNPGSSSSGGVTGPGQPPPGITSPSAKDYFIKTVFPELTSTCGGCHNPPGSAGAPAFWNTDAATAYTSIEARGYITTASMLLRKGQHTGPALTAQEGTDIQTWLAMEAQVRGSNTPDSILSKLGNCIDATKFTAIGLDKLRTVKRTNENANQCTGCNQAACESCHTSGEYAMHANFGNIGTKTLAALQANGTSPEGIYIISKYVSTNGTQLVASTALKDKATATSTGVAYSHPMFTVTPAMETAVEAFAQDIITKYNAKTCGQ